MIDRDADTLPTLETLTELIKGFQRDVNTRLDNLESRVSARLDNLERRLQGVETKGEELRLQMLSLETRHDRLASQVHEMGAYVYAHNADLRILTAELRAWVSDTVALRQRLENSLR